MPELPEVQTIVNDLSKKISGATIVDFKTSFTKAVKAGLPLFRKCIIGKKIIGIKRRGKYVLMQLENSFTLIFHLRMTGNLVVANRKAPKNTNRELFFFSAAKEYIRHYFTLEMDKKRFFLLFSDVRKFGTIDLCRSDAVSRKKEFQKMGLEPFSENFTLASLKKLLDKKCQTSIRKILLDQAAIAGIGNIYASEILYQAGIDPRKISAELDEKQVLKLRLAIIRVLRRAIKYRGTTISDYKDADGKSGSFQHELEVYGRKDKPCKRRNCRGKIKREVIGQRSAFYCPKCQK